MALRQRADLLYANISANKISLPQGQSYTERKHYCYNTVPLKKTYFAKKYQEIKTSEISTPSTDTSRPSRELYRSSQIPTRQCQNPSFTVFVFSSLV